MRATIRLALIEDFLREHGWVEVRQGSRFNEYAPPKSLDIDDAYTLTIPSSENAKDSQQFLSRVIIALAEIYETSPERLRAQLVESETIFSIRLVNRKTAEGTVPFLQFEALVENLKKTLLDVASFVITEAHIIESTPEEAYHYLGKCHFLQTARGSYITQVQLPTKATLSQPHLFSENEDIVTEADVTSRLEDIIAFVAGPILSGRQDIFSETSLAESLDLVNVNVLKDIAELVSKTEAEELDFGFLGSGREQIIRTGILSEQKRERLTRFIDFAREQFAADEIITAVGKIVELRSRNRERGRNFVGIAAILNGREELVTLRLSPQDYFYAVLAHQKNNSVRVEGYARRLKTQYRITRLLEFQELEHS